MPSSPTPPQDPDAPSAPGPAATASPDASSARASGPETSGAEAPGTRSTGTRSTGADTAAASEAPARKPRAVRKQVLLRLDPAVHDAVARWADDELRSVNAQIEVILREALGRAGRAPRDAAPLPRRGRPPAT